MTPERSRKRGRPAKAADERKDANFTFRVSPPLRSQLEASAEAAHRSISSEIEYALLDYYRQREEFTEVTRLVGAAIRATEQKIGRHWFADEEAQRLCRVAADVALNVALCQRPNLEDEFAALKARLTEAKESNAGPEVEASIIDDMEKALARYRAETALAHDVAVAIENEILKLRTRAPLPRGLLAEIFDVRAEASSTAPSSKRKSKQ